MSTSHSIQGIRVIGLDEPTVSDKARDSLLLRVLQDETKLTQADFVRFIWFRTEEDTQRLQQPSTVVIDHPSLKPHLKHLNASQSAVVASMIDVNPLTVVHGLFWSMGEICHSSSSLQVPLAPVKLRLFPQLRKYGLKSISILFGSSDSLTSPSRISPRSC